MPLILLKLLLLAFGADMFLLYHCPEFLANLISILNEQVHFEHWCQWWANKQPFICVLYTTMGYAGAAFNPKTTTLSCWKAIYWTLTLRSSRNLWEFITPWKKTQLPSWYGCIESRHQWQWLPPPLLTSQLHTTQGYHYRVQHLVCSPSQILHGLQYSVLISQWWWRLLLYGCSLLSAQTHVAAWIHPSASNH